MTDTKQSPPPPAWPLWGPWQIMAEMMGNRYGAATPGSLSQPILPGWTFGNQITVTEQNSSAPETEREIVAAQSYGRQLGRVIDALAVLIEERPKGAKHEEALARLGELEKEIRDIKSKSAARRIERLKSDLALLKKEKPDEYRRFVAELKTEF